VYLASGARDKVIKTNYLYQIRKRKDKEKTLANEFNKHNKKLFDFVHLCRNESSFLYKAKLEILRMSVGKLFKVIDEHI